jgi:hypothetical protein
MVNTIAQVQDDYLNSQTVTSGDYKNEDEAKDAFRVAAKDCEFFNVYEEVDCWYFGGSVFGDKPTGRIDFVLTPKPSLIAKGWLNGCVGVETKKSGHKAGPLICQMIDYSKAVFRLPDHCGASLICLTCVFAFPGIAGRDGFAHSIMSQHRLGNVIIGKRGLELNVNSTHAFCVFNGQVRVNNIRSGFKNGSR